MWQVRGIHYHHCRVELINGVGLIWGNSLNTYFRVPAQLVDATQVVEATFSQDPAVHAGSTGLPVKNYGAVRYPGRPDWIHHELHFLATESSPNNFELVFVFLSHQSPYKDNGDHPCP